MPESFGDPTVVLPMLGADEQAVFFEAADLPVYRVPAPYWVGRPLEWPCDLYIASYPDAGVTVAFDHEAFGPFLSLP